MTAEVNRPGRQLDLVLPARPADDVLRDRLADLVARFDASTCPGEQVQLDHEIRELRQLLRMESLP